MGLKSHQKTVQSEFIVARGRLDAIGRNEFESSSRAGKVEALFMRANSLHELFMRASSFHKVFIPRSISREETEKEWNFRVRSVASAKKKVKISVRVPLKCETDNNCLCRFEVRQG